MRGANAFRAGTIRCTRRGSQGIGCEEGADPVSLLRVLWYMKSHVRPLALSIL